MAERILLQSAAIGALGYIAMQYMGKNERPSIKTDIIMQSIEPNRIRSQADMHHSKGAEQPVIPEDAYWWDVINEQANEVESDFYADFNDPLHKSVEDGHYVSDRRPDVVIINQDA